MTIPRFVGCVLLLVLAATGCGSKTGQVSGKVTFKGKPLPYGTVQFHSADGNVTHSLLASDGSYAIPDVPRGLVKITVDSHGRIPLAMLQGGRDGPGGKALPKEVPEEAKFVPIPERFADPVRSGLTLLVQGGRQSHDIPLQP